MSTPELMLQGHLWGRGEHIFQQQQVLLEGVLGTDPPRLKHTCMLLLCFIVCFRVGGEHWQDTIGLHRPAHWARGLVQRWMPTSVSSKRDGLRSPHVATYGVFPFALPSFSMLGGFFERTARESVQGARCVRQPCGGAASQCGPSRPAWCPAFTVFLRLRRRLDTAKRAK